MKMSFQNKPKNLDLSYKTESRFSDCFEREKERLVFGFGLNNIYSFQENTYE